MSTAAPPSQPVSNGTTSHTSPPPPTSQQQQPPSPSSSTPRAISAAGGGGGFGQNAVAGPSRNVNPSFPAGSFSNIGQPNGVAPNLANGPTAQTQDPTALQARLIQAQQAMQANMQQQNQMPGQGAQDTNGGGAGVGGSGGGGPTAKMASAIGMLQGQPGSAVSKEAMMRQLQALSQSRQQQERASTSQASPPNPTTANLQSLSNPPPNPVAPLQQNGAIPNGTPTPNPQPQGPPPHPNIGPQRRQFCQSLLSYHKHTNQPVPPELFAGERPGTLAMGDHTVELVDLFMAIMRQAPGRAGMLQNGEPHKVFYDYVDRNFPNPLPAPVKCPKPVGSSLPIPDETTDPVRFLFMAYVTYLQGFETHMMRQRSAMAQQQKQPQQQQQQQGGPPVNAPTPTNMVSTPITAPSPAGTYTGAPSPHPSLPAHIAPSPVAHTPSPPASAKPKGKRGPKPKLPPAIQADAVATAVGSPATPTTVSGKKRKKGMDESGSGGSRPQTPTTALPPPMPISNIPPAPPPRPPTPKRARYKVEYRPLHHPITHLCGWDERAVSSTFPKHNLAQPARSVHELGIVDMEAVLMGLRSRLKREMGYGLTVLNMLSMPHPEENIGGLPLLHLREIYDELLELLQELVLGDKGLGSLGDDRMTYLELEQLGRDIDWSNHPPESHTDTILSIVNLLRNFTMMPDNFSIMAGPELFHLIAAISHSSLLGNPYSVLDLGRIRRDCVSILANLAPFLDLRRLEFWAVKGIFQLLASFLNTAWESLGGKESWWTPYNSAPPPTIHSINRALEAWCKLAQADSNREVLARLPSEELVELYTNLVKLLPVSARQFDALRSIEDTLGLTECLALSIYSLVFLSPSSTRTLMRAVPGTVPVFLRIIEMTASAVPPSQSASLTDSVDFRTNPFAVLCRRIAETLGILNGTASCMADIGSGSVSFGSASAGEGWSYANQQVEPGWLAGKEDLVLGVVARNGLDPFVRMELDGMWWTGGEGSGMM